MSGLMDEFRRLRIRGERWTRPGLIARPDDPPTLIGQVISPSAKIAVGKFLLVNPVAAFGAEVEGGVGSANADTGSAIPVLLVGPTAPAPGDYLVCHFVQHRWIAARNRVVGGGGGPITIGIPGCFCQGTPASLSLTVSFAADETAATYGNAYRNCTLAYYGSTPPGYLPRAAYPGPAYYSMTSWVDDYGFTDYLTLSCYSTQYSLAIGQYGGGTWQAPGQVYLWSVGGRDSVNFCSPFLLARGQTTPGFHFNGRFTISG